MEKELSHVLKHRSSQLPGCWRCADDLQLAAYVDGTLEANARSSLEAHVADCPVCLRQISFLVNASGWPESGDIPPWLVTKAKSLVSGSRKAPIGFGWRWAAPTVATVLVVAALAVLIIRFRNSNPPPGNLAQSGPPQESPRVDMPGVNPSPRPDAVAMTTTPVPEKVNDQKDKPAVPQVRDGAREMGSSPRLIFPRDGANVRRGALEFRWRGHPDAVFYEVSIMTPPGELVMSRQTQETSMKIPPEISLTPTQKYFASVRGHLRDGKTARSSIVSFQVIE